MLKKYLTSSAIISLMFLCFASNAHAQIKIEGTRLIYFGKDKEASITVINRSNADTIMQSWISSSDESNDVPFAIVQPLTLLTPHGHHALRILYAGNGLPIDKESLFWLNILEIPHRSEAKDNLQFAIRQRLKLFFRPIGLTGSASEAVNNLKWQRHSNKAVEIKNSSAFHISLIDITLIKSGQSHQLSDYVLLHPGETFTLETPTPLSSNSEIAFREITDIGLQKPHKVMLL